MITQWENFYFDIFSNFLSTCMNERMAHAHFQFPNQWTEQTRDHDNFIEMTVILLYVHGHFLNMHRVVCPFCRQQSKYVYTFLFETVTLWKVTEREKKKTPARWVCLGYKLYLLYLHFGLSHGCSSAESAECGSPETRQTAQRCGDPETHLWGPEVWHGHHMCGQPQDSTHQPHLQEKEPAHRCAVFPLLWGTTAGTFDFFGSILFSSSHWQHWRYVACNYVIVYKYWP